MNAQEYYSGPLIQILKSTNVNHDFQLKNSIELRNRLFQNIDNDEANLKSSQERISLQSIVETKRLSHLNFGAGLMYRLNNASNNQFRTIQQLTHKYNLYHLKAGTRFRLDQTWRADADLTLRLRYRYMVQVPLNGLILDKKEWYLKSGFEVLGVFNETESMESRILFNVGSLREKLAKTEFGFDYRIHHLSTAIHTLWFNVNLYIN